MIRTSSKKHIDQNVEKKIRKQDIAETVHLSADYVTRIFKKETGMTIKSYIIQQKMLDAQHLLQTTGLSVSYIAAKLGYSNFSHFSSAYKKQMGLTPMEERERAVKTQAHKRPAE